MNNLGELLAVIHGDGGQYRAEHGDDKATHDAIDRVLAMRDEIAALEEDKQFLRSPDNSMVICPACTSQFIAIPVDVQSERRALQERIAWAWSIIASASGGDWSEQSTDWCEAARAWERAGDPYAGLGRAWLSNQIEAAKQRIAETPAYVKGEHASDCAVHNEPALPTSPCNCGAAQPPPDELTERLIYAAKCVCIAYDGELATLPAYIHDMQMVLGELAMAHS